MLDCVLAIRAGRFACCLTLFTLRCTCTSSWRTGDATCTRSLTMPLERARAWRRRWRTRSRAECRTAKSTASCTGTSSPKTCSSKQPAATPRRVCDQRRPGISRECQWRFDPASRARASHVASSFALVRAACLAGGRGCQALRFRAVRDRPTGGRRGGHARHEGRAQRVEAQPESNPELARCWASRHFAEHRARDRRGRSPPRRAEVDALGLFGLARLRCPRGSPPAGARCARRSGPARLPATVPRGRPPPLSGT